MNAISMQSQRNTLRLLVLAALLLGFLAALGVKSQHMSFASVRPLATKGALVSPGVIPPTDAQCRASATQRPCYSPQEIRNAYGVTSLIDRGFTGKGQTIVIIDSFGSPTLANDLKVFDKGYGLPDPPRLTVLSPLGTVPFDPNNSDQQGWAAETTLDVEWAHALAPDANVLVMTSPVSETEGVQGLPEFLFLEKYVVNQHLGQIISQSWTATENTLFDNAGKYTIGQFENFYREAVKAHITIFGSSGDSGSANPGVNGKIYPFPTVGYPASSPYVTAVGGTSLFADTKGSYQSEVVWDQPEKIEGSGGGISQYFGEPDYQKQTLPEADQQLLKGHRGVPDISYNADPRTSILIYLSAPGNMAGYYRIGGTSEGSPQWAAIIADANQYAHHALGFLNPALYKLGSDKEEAAVVYHDITVGDNGVTGVAGYKATLGWDAATGWGTPHVAQLVKELTSMT
ncbi:MAG: S53 family peptidase [Ktedonobacteraceae bacterium]|nr:S53 family peptidase [Ktedonobacteraceae bacterium]